MSASPPPPPRCSGIRGATAASREADTGAAPAAGVLRSTPSISRSSVSACRPMSPTSAAFRTAFSGSFNATACNAAACTTIRDTRCATTSCISRAIRRRSSFRAHSARSSARSASSCSSRSRLSARSRNDSISRRRAPTYRPSSTGGAVCPSAVVTAANSWNHPSTSGPVRTSVTTSTPVSDIPASAPVRRRGRSEEATV